MTAHVGFSRDSRSIARRSWYRVFSALHAFGQSRDGNMAVIFGLVLLPVTSLAGGVIDYSRASNVKSGLQAALDSAVLAGALDGTTQWADVALKAFKSNLVREAGPVAAPTFSRNADGTYAGKVTAAVPTAFLGVIGMSSITVGATAVVAAARDPDNSCILTLDPGQSLSHQSMVFNGAPDINLSGCSIRSNTSLSCNGHAGGAMASLAAGTVSGCSNPKPNSSVVPDIYASLAGNITTKCAGSRPGATWEPGTLPSPPKLTTVSRGSYTEYHVCGDLTLSGTGFLTGSSPSSDSVIIIENGSLTINNKASITALRTVFVLTGNNAHASSINFPTGNGHGATLTLSPPTDPDNPWRGVSVYQDPRLTNNVGHDWGPGATFNADGVVYMPNADVVISGSSSSSNSRCTKIVSRTFTTNGTVDLDFAQTANGCTRIGMKQWPGLRLRLTQ